jgi:acyl-CoA thioesterase
MLSMKGIRDYFQNDRFAKHIGVEILEVAPGYAKARMQIQDYHLNAADVIHGAAIFGLADLVFAVASNSHGKVALGINVSVSYLKAARGNLLFAEAREISRKPKLATYTMDVTDEQAEHIATMIGTVYRKTESIQAG